MVEAVSGDVIVFNGEIYNDPDGPRYHPVRSKALLRRIGLRGLDPALFDRPKSGFVLPYDRIREGLSKSIDETLRDPDAVRAAGLRPEPVGRLWKAFLDGGLGLYCSRMAHPFTEEVAQPALAGDGREGVVGALDHLNAEIAAPAQLAGHRAEVLFQHVDGCIGGAEHQ